MPTQTAAGYPTASLQTTPQQHFLIFNRLSTGKLPSLTPSVVVNIPALLPSRWRPGREGCKPQRTPFIKNQEKTPGSPSSRAMPLAGAGQEGGTPRMVPRPLTPGSLPAARSVRAALGASAAPTWKGDAILAQNCSPLQGCLLSDTSTWTN